VLISEQKQTLPVGLSNVARSVAFETDPSLLAAGVLLALLPPFLLFALVGRGLLR
jgi:ABC-type glycerol-3-phosphate transport system permease component